MPKRDQVIPWVGNYDQPKRGAALSDARTMRPHLARPVNAGHLSWAK